MLTIKESLVIFSIYLYFLQESSVERRIAHILKQQMTNGQKLIFKLSAR